MDYVAIDHPEWLPVAHILFHLGLHRIGAWLIGLRPATEEERRLVQARLAGHAKETR